MQSRLMAVNHVERYTGCWSYIQWSFCNHENEGNTNNLRCILYSLNAVFGVCCTWRMLYAVYAVLGVCCTRCMLYLVNAVLSGNSRSWDHQQNIFPSGRNGSVGVDVLRRSCQRHPSGWLLGGRCHINASRSRLPSDHCFTVSSLSVSLLL